ncbi:MAG TPA: malate dehydrogenase [Candidatus Aquicultor sp.]|jgi:malate dehydrogenase
MSEIVGVMMAKVSVIGAGNVGATCAYTLLKNKIADVVLVDVVDGLAKGKAIDMMQAGAIEGYGQTVTGTTEYAEVAESDVVVITAGLARQPGMSRSDLLGKNAAILGSIAANVVSQAPDAILVVVTNPMDVMAYLAYKLSGLTPERVIGMGGVLDTARYKYFVAQALDTTMTSIEGIVIGAHGDSMVPVVSDTKINGWPLLEMVNHEQAHQIVEKTKNGGAEIVSYLKTGSAFYAPGAAAAKMVDHILSDRKDIVPAAVYAQGQYDISDMYIGLPARIGAQGVDEIVELPLSDVELEALHQSAASVKTAIAELKEIVPAIS